METKKPEYLTGGSLLKTSNKMATSPFGLRYPIPQSCKDVQPFEELVYKKFTKFCVYCSCETLGNFALKSPTAVSWIYPVSSPSLSLTSRP